MTDGAEDATTRFARWWARRYTAGLPDHARAVRRTEIDSDLAEHARYRTLDGWTPRQIRNERLRRLVRGMPADVGWRHEVVTRHARAPGLVRASVLSVTSTATAILAVFHFAFAAYLLGNTSLSDQRFLGGLDNYADEVGRPVASVIAASVIAGLGLVLLTAAVARPISPVVANAVTLAIAGSTALFFWLGAWPVALIAVLGSVVDLAGSTPNPTSRP